MKIKVDLYREEFREFKERNWNGMDTSLEWKIVVGERLFTSGHRTVGGEEEDRNNNGKPSDGLHETQKHGRRNDRK